ncbi:DUF3971 domain-containing protein [Pseudoroseicyclus tamaricis]|uniref:DUF3971 domain-containing protein n=1 Tax=Pseudoroseicyclus tamaricis TaxID=2705421 RepID=A0A6B2K216_9RHOB|nr:DUF3971 domain-containing protein [Pseudoroseicyclus tamaricis]NDV00456.1 DUF3971 domain-containing protein [Pseudoroseicyclus tamaricis]
MAIDSEARQAPAGPGQGGTAPTPRRRRWLILTRGAPAAVGAVLLAALLSPLLLIGQEVSAPSWVARRVEAGAEAALEGGEIAFREMSLIVGEDLHPRVRLAGARLSDAGGREVAVIPQIDMLFSPRGLLLERELLVQEVVITGAELSLRRAASGDLALSFGETEAEVGQAEGFTGLLAGFDALFDRPALAALEAVRAEGLVVNYQDSRAGRSWVVDGGRLALEVADGQTRLTGDLALLSGRAYVTTLALEYRSARGSPAAEIALDLRDVAARDIATQSPALSWLGLLDAPLSARLTGSVTEAGALGPLAAELSIGAGTLSPDPAAPGIPFQAASAALAFDAASGALAFSRVELLSDWGRVQAEGETWLEGMEDGLPSGLTGQFRLSDSSLNLAGLLPAPLELDEAHATIRLGLEPFRLEVAEAGMTLSAGPRLTGAGEVAVAPEGWRVSADAHLPRLTMAEARALWPPDAAATLRGWVVENIPEGTLTDVAAGLALRPGAPPRMQVTAGFEAATIRAVSTYPPITGGAGALTFDGGSMTVLLEEGFVSPPQGGRLDMAGTSFSMPDISIDPRPIEVRLAAAGSITAGLSLLDQPPFEFLTKANRPVTLADGRMRAWGVIRMPLTTRPPPGSVTYEIEAALSEVVSDQLVPGRELRTSALNLTVDNDALRIGGPARIGAAPFTFAWRLPIVPRGAPRPVAELTADVTINPAVLDEFDIALPPGTVVGEGAGDLAVSLPPGGPPAFRLTSDLAGLTVAIPQVGWRKPAGTAGRLELSGTLGDVPQVEGLLLTAPGLDVRGAVSLNAEGGLARARFDRLQVGGWLDAPVDLVGRGAGLPAQVEMRGGTLDLGRAEFASGAESGPLEVALDRLQVTDEIALTGFQGSFGAGLSGQFAALVNGGQEVAGATEPTAEGLAVRLRSADAGAVLRSLDLFETAVGGALDLVLLPAEGEGSYDGSLTVTDIRLQDAPAMAALLDAVSVVGALQQLGGQGLVFDEVEAAFRLDPGLITLRQASAVGPGLGISLDGYYSTASRIMDFQGVVSPFYFINSIGSVLTRPGEGLIGFNFTLAGPVSEPAVAVNPLSVLTPGMFREIFRRPPPEAE